MNGDEQKTGLFILIVLCILTIAAISLVLILSIDEPLPPDPLADMDVEVTDVVIADGLWLNESWPLWPSGGWTTVALKVNVTNNGTQRLMSSRIPFQVVRDSGNVTDVHFLNVLDPRLDGDPFGEYMVFIQPGESKEGWIGVSFPDSQMNWTEAELRIPTEVEERKSPSTRFNITGAQRLHGLVSRFDVHITSIRMVDEFDELRPTGGHILYVIKIVVINRQVRRVYPSVEFQLEPSDRYERPITERWDGGRGWMDPGENRTVTLVYDLSSYREPTSITVAEDVPNKYQYIGIHLPIEPWSIIADFDPARVGIEVESVSLFEELQGHLCEDGSMFVVASTRFTSEWGDMTLDAGNLTIMDRYGSEHHPTLGLVGYFKEKDTIHVDLQYGATGDLVFTMPRSETPFQIIYDDHGQWARDEIDEVNITNTLGWPMLDISVEELTFTDWLDDRYQVIDDTKEILLVRLNVSHRWSWPVGFNIENLTLFDDNGSEVGYPIMNMFAPDRIVGSSNLMEGDWVSGQVHLFVPAGWVPGRLVYEDPKGNISVDLDGTKVTRLGPQLLLDVEVNWHVITSYFALEKSYEDKVFFISNMTFTNMGERPVDLVDTWYNPIAENGSNYNVRADDFNREHFPWITLEKNDTYTGMICFKIPKGEVPVEIEYRYGRVLRLPVDPDDIRYMEIGDSIDMTINDAYWTGSIGGREPLYSESYLVVNVTISSDWLETLHFNLNYFILIEENGYWNMHDMYAQDLLEDGWEDVELPMGTSATGQLVFDIFNGSSPKTLMYFMAMYNVSTDIDLDQIRNETGTLCAWIPPTSNGDKDHRSTDMYMRSIGPIGLDRQSSIGSTNQAVAVKGPDKN